MLGPGLLTDGQTGEPITKLFAEYLEEDLRPRDYDDAESGNLPYIAMRWLATMRGVAIDDLQAEFAGFLAERLDNIPPIYRELADLPFSFVLNTAPDNYIYQSYLLSGKQSTLLHYNHQRNQKYESGDFPKDSTIIYNLLGKHSDPESLVITKEDQLCFIDNVVSQRVSTIPSEIYNQLPPDKYYLFLGFNATTWHLPLLFRRLLCRDNAKPELNAYIDSFSSNETLVDFYEQSLSFNFVEDRALDFAQELKDQYINWLETNREPTNIRRKRHHSSDASSILIMTSQPKDTEAIELIAEYNQIEEALLKAPLAQNFTIKPILNIPKRRLLEVVLRYKPKVLHFSGHGINEGVLLYGNDGYADILSVETFANLLEQFKEVIECVVLNACYTQDTAQAIAKHIPYVIGTETAIGDEVAQSFSTGFYTALFAGEEYEKAFNIAIAAVGIEGFASSALPSLIKNGTLTAPKKTV